MRGPHEVLGKVERRYQAVWRDALLGADPGLFSLALSPPSASAIADRPGDVSAWLTRWREWATQHPNVALRTRSLSTKFGTQSVHTHLDIPDTHTLAGLNPDTAAHWERARARWDRLRPHHPGEAVRPWLSRIVDLDDYDFTTLLAATVWFRANPRSGLTVRRVPVLGMHTKWLARHRALVRACLGVPTDSADSLGNVDPADVPADVRADDLDILGLRPVPREISVVLLDPALRAIVGGLRQISAPVDELGRLRLLPDVVLVVENKEPALSWSDTPGLAIIHSLGNYLDVLTSLPWIPHDRCWYWSDLDRHGFTLLSRARSFVPALMSLLMAPEDVETYRPLGVIEGLDRYDPPDPTLSPEEVHALAALQLTENYLRIEQERIPIGDAEHALEHARRLVELTARRSSVT